ncbi:hypothetical protein DFJ43DRAFT_1051662 [Lentinula guzmanii]|uniref:Secreted protein n=1 Tax=Lentinula guzmanii TaxID=2804957 RepID=A0AA38JU87_9AGAR|nr:hypothetical protein DFJ43DRAFT_1051662 [Lentinula guzmanii]
MCIPMIIFVAVVSFVVCRASDCLADCDKSIGRGSHDGDEAEFEEGMCHSQSLQNELWSTIPAGYAFKWRPTIIGGVPRGKPNDAYRSGMRSGSISSVINNCRGILLPDWKKKNLSRSACSIDLKKSHVKLETNKL